MTVILFRHGHKSFAADANPPLSARGFDQAKNLEHLVEQKILPAPTHCWHSEKIRTQQTLQECFLPGVFTFNKPELNYREHNEDAKNFRHRIQKFINEIAARTAKNEVHFICTHVDWIEESMSIIDSDRDLNTYELSSWAPGQYVQFEIQDHIFHYVKKGVL